jgi:hypothetical protein
MSPLSRSRFAKEIRSYENVNNGITTSSSSSSSTEEQGGIFHQWRGEAYTRFFDIATGRNRIRPRQRTLANIRCFLN